MLEQSNLIAKIFEKMDSLTCDRLSIPQEKLDLTHKSRSSIFPWRGQFSPELVEVLLDKYSKANTVVFDPFVGSGTTIFEAANLGLTCYGAEINPAAIIMAKTADFINLNLTERQQIIQQSLCLADKYLTPFLPRDLFNYQQQELSSESHQNIELFLQELFKVSSENLYIQNIIANGIIRFVSYRKPKEITDFRRALFEHGKIITKLPYSQKKCQVLHTDARKIPLPDFSVDLVITSPPYINVFNYHQNHRPAMELMGWELLKVAKSEIGSNRKHRQNRFLTVIQYALDMFAVLQEMRRLLRSNGKVIIVIGRKSTIRKIGIENTKLIATIALEGAGFELESLQERKFKNKFGEIIYEDILHLIPSSKTFLPGDEFACLVAQSLLLEVSKNAQGEVLNEILKARENANNVQKSPLFKNGRVLI